MKKWIDFFCQNLSLDSRSLALFRVCISSLFLIDFFFTRLPYFTLFYTEQGLSPIKSISDNYSYLLRTFSLNFLSSITLYQYVLFFIAIGFFISLLIGYKTKWAALGSWILVTSFFSKNPLIYNSGDILAYLMLFWALLLPMGNHFSIDRALSNQKEKYSTVFSINSCAFILQLLMIYLFTYQLKQHNIWENNQAVYYALMLDNFRTVFGDVLLQYPQIMQGLSYITYHIIEKHIFFAFLLFGYWWKAKMFLIFVMCGFHFSLGIFLHLGFFSWFCITAWLAFLPAEFWNWIQTKLPKKNQPLTVYYDGDCSFCEKSTRLLKTFLILPHVSFKKAKEDPKATQYMEQKNSWLIMLSDENVIVRWDVFAHILSYSPLFFYLSPICRLKWVSKVGDYAYGMVSQKRGKLDQIIPQIKEDKPSSNFFASHILPGFFLFCLLYVLAWNIRELDFNKHEKYFSTKFNGLGHFFHLYQKWNVFSPPPSQSEWIVLFGVIKNKDRSETKINLWEKGKPIQINAPSKRYDRTFPVFRFRKMMEKSSSKWK